MFLDGSRELLAAVKQHRKKAELAFEWRTELLVGVAGPSAVIQTGYQHIVCLYLC